MTPFRLDCLLTSGMTLCALDCTAIFGLWQW